MNRLLSSAAIGSLIGIAVGSLVAPRALAQTYGLPAQDRNGLAYVRAMGIRDGALGAIGLAFTLRDNRAALRTTLGLSTLVACGDFALVLAARGRSAWPSLALHASGVVGLIALVAFD